MQPARSGRRPWSFYALSAFFALAWCGGYALFYSLFRPHLHRLEDR